jgi:hypothetical protein
MFSSFFLEGINAQGPGNRALCVCRCVIDQGWEEQPVHLAMLTSKAAVTTRTQVNISGFCGIIFCSFGAPSRSASRETSRYQSQRSDMCLKNFRIEELC